MQQVQGLTASRGALVCEGEWGAGTATGSSYSVLFPPPHTDEERSVSR